MTSLFPSSLSPYFIPFLQSHGEGMEKMKCQKYSDSIYLYSFCLSSCLYLASASTFLFLKTFSAFLSLALSLPIPYVFWSPS